MKNYKNIISIAVIVILIAGAGIYIYYDLNKTLEPVASAIAVDENISVELEGGGVAKVEMVSVENTPAPAIPSLDKPLIFPDGFTDDAKKVVTEKTRRLTADLKNNPDNFSAWLDLAIYRKMIHDYQGAKEIWEYLNKAYPTQSISFGNLGDLYHYFLKDFPKAEVNFKQAIANSPNRIDLYRGLFELYKYSYKQNTSAAEDILLSGLKANPDNPDLQNLLAQERVIHNWLSQVFHWAV